jgi:hypothetical protein
MFADAVGRALTSIDMRRFGVTLLAASIMLAAGSSIHAQSCADASGLWTDTLLAQWTLAQNADGSINGKFASIASGSCPPAGQQPPQYILSGSYNGGGNFKLTATESGSTLQGCATTIFVSGKVSGGGCDKASINWTNNENDVGFGSWSHICFIPPGETTTFSYWNTADFEPTVAHFHVVLNGSTNYGGRTEQETFPNPATYTDTCHFANSAFAPFVPTAAAAYTLQATDDNAIADNIGPAQPTGNDPNVILYYRAHQRAPCEFGAVQVMTLSCDSSSPGYATNQLTISIADKTISVSRNGVSSGPLVWGTSQTAYRAAYVNAVLGLLLMTIR